MKKRSSLLLFLTIIILAQIKAQIDYLEEQFDYSIITDVTYGGNTTILPALFPITEPMWRPLIMDIYQPNDGGQINRPVILVFHDGFFLPANPVTT